MGNIDLLIQEVESALSSYKIKHSGLDWRQKVLLLVEINKGVKSLGIISNPESAKVAARERLKLYLTQYVGTIINSQELEVVSGISEYARRVRELRVQEGFKILTGNSNDPEYGLSLRPNEYILIDNIPDISAANRWYIINRIRRDNEAGSQGRILKFLLQYVGHIVTSEEIAYVAKAKEFGRRVRELRTEAGYPIATIFTGRPDLKMGEYVLESSERIAEPHDRKISFEIQKAVYERAENKCENCGWDHKRWKKNDPRILEIHHIKEHAKGGKNTLENLIVLCSKCHDEIHSGKRNLPKAFR